jgi:hypothetical protein
MMGGVLVVKYSNPRNPIINVQINNTLIGNTLIDIGFSIKIMTQKTMSDLGITRFKTPQP